MVRNSGNGQNLLGICWEIWRNMQMRFTGTKCLIRHWEYFPVWILGMLCKIPIRFSQCLVRHWEWWETAGNLLGNSTNYANEMFRYKMSDQTPGISSSQAFPVSILGMLCKIPTMSQHFPVCVIRHWEYLPNKNAGIVGKIISLTW